MKLSINKVDLMPYVKGIVLLMVFVGIVISIIDKNDIPRLYELKDFKYAYRRGVERTDVMLS